MYLASLSWTKAKEIEGEGVVAVLPLGSLEEHGPVGPLGTDYIIPEAMAARLEASMPEREPA